MTPPSPWLVPVRVASVVLGVGVVGIGVMSVVTVFATQVDTTTVTVSDPVTALDVNTHSGNVTLRPGPVGSEISVEVTTHAAFRDADWTRAVDGGTLALTSACTGGWPIYNCEVDFDVIVPSDRLDDLEVDVETGSGSQSVSGTGDVTRLHAGSGDIQVSGFTGTELSADTGSGDIDVYRAEATDATLKTGSGNVGAEFTGPSAAQVTAQAGSGDVTTSFTAAPDRVTARTGSGDVRISVPQDGTRYDVDGDSGSGDRQVLVPSSDTGNRLSANSGSGDVWIGFN